MVKDAFAVSDVQGFGFPRLESLREVALVDSRSGAVQCAVLCFRFIFRNILAQQSKHTTTFSIQRAQRLMNALRFAITLTTWVAAFVTRRPGHAAGRELEWRLHDKVAA